MHEETINSQNGLKYTLEMFWIFLYLNIVSLPFIL